LEGVSRAAQPDPGAETRTRLARERVLRAAIELADQAGVEFLSMRKLGQKLGVEAMSLYNHVANKEDLLDGMVDLVFGEIGIPPLGLDWQAAMRQRANSARKVLAHHLWAIGLMQSRRRPGPATLRHYDAVMGCLQEAGFSMALAAHAYLMLDSYTYGFALQEASLAFKTAAEAPAGADPLLPADVYPHLTETAIQRAQQSAYNYAEEFEFGLDLILEGLERLRNSA
jgi:AcrR family transcriptional regulator